ncbi:hypothetical protein KTT_26810 [Tengunoibacter tsumagoiensis]|uniref:Uncharacterized protein n=1 Tax=Tengunoibacter tsumagoiensis TaxID=2014871 RepID=A0A402A193_9CHLR|nr:hypothetical protein KTT_26810 [Tengunoibacter tsumagoiensis]
MKYEKNFVTRLGRRDHSLIPSWIINIHAIAGRFLLTEGLLASEKLLPFLGHSIQSIGRGF